MSGEPLENPQKKPVLLGTVLSNIMAGKTANPALSWVLGKKFAIEDEVDLLAEEVVFVKDEVKKLGVKPEEQGGWLSGLLCGQILEILEGKDAKAKPLEKTADKSGKGKK